MGTLLKILVAMRQDMIFKSNEANSWIDGYVYDTENNPASMIADSD